MALVFGPWPSTPFGNDGSAFTPGQALLGSDYPVATLATLISRVRRFIGDYPEQDVLTASLSASLTTATVADTTIYSTNWRIQVEQELLRIKALPSATTLTVLRGAEGTTAATHVNSSTILVRPAFGDQEIIDALNAGINAAFPLLYKQVLDTTLSADAATYEFTVPYMPSTTVYIPRIARVEIQESGDTVYSEAKDWDIRRGATPKIKFRRAPSTGTIRVVGYGPFPNLATVSDSLDALWPGWAEDILVEYAAQRLLIAGEARRVRQDTGSRDERESATRTGSSATAANALYQRFQVRLRDAAMPPMPPHTVSVI